MTDVSTSYKGLLNMYCTRGKTGVRASGRGLLTCNLRRMRRIGRKSLVTT